MDVGYIAYNELIFFSMLQHNLPDRIQIGNTYVGKGEPAYFIAEIGNNHNGDFYLAKRTIEEAVKAGANAVKFQKRFINETFAKELREKPQTKDQIYGTTYGEYRKALELDKEEFIKLKTYAESLGVTFFATPFDKSSADFLEEVGDERSLGMLYSNFGLLEQDTGRLVMTKLFRGVANLTTGWMEIPKQMIQTSNEKGFWKGISWGFAKGLGWAMGRTATGAYEIVTFPFPIPEDYHPVIHPEYVLSDLPGNPQP